MVAFDMVTFDMVTFDMVTPSHPTCSFPHSANAQDAVKKVTADDLPEFYNITLERPKDDPEGQDVLFVEAAFMVGSFSMRFGTAKQSGLASNRQPADACAVARFFFIVFQPYLHKSVYCVRPACLLC